MPDQSQGIVPNKFYYVKTVLLVTVFAVLFLHLVSFIPTLLGSLQDLEQAKNISFLNDISDDLFTAVGNFGFERGRVNVVLNDAGPVESMEGNRQFILARRQEGDQALANALAKLESAGNPYSGPQIERIKELTADIEKLRLETSVDLVKPRPERTEGLAETWFAAMTDYIQSIQALLINISSKISDQDGMISRYSALKWETMALRNSAGPEMSILSGTILSGAPLAPRLAKKITDLQVETKVHFENLNHLSGPLTDPRIPQALQELEQSYFKNFVPLRDVVFPLALEGGPYPYSQTGFLQPGVSALNQIAAFMGTLVQVTDDYAARKLEESRNEILQKIVLGLGSLLLILLIFYFINFRLIRPLSRVTSAVLRLAHRDPGVEVPLTGAQNEIGEMARAVEVFKGMALQLDQHVVELEKASEDREKLIGELQTTLHEIKILRGILPICSICKNIRNDQGYYEQIESYIHKHSGVDFSHTICPTCMKNHYPDEFSSMNL